MSAARTALLTELGRALGANAATSPETDTPPAAKRALPAHLYHSGPPPGPASIPAPRKYSRCPTIMEQDARALRALGEERLLRFILSRRRR